MFSDDPYYESDSFKEILHAYERMADTGEYGYMDADDLTDVADYYTSVREYKKARACLRYCLRLHPRGSAPRIASAYLCMVEDNLQRAEEILDTISDQDNDEIIFVRAEIALKREKTGEAQQMMEKFYDETHCLSDDELRLEFIRDAATLFADYHASDAAYHWFDLLTERDPDSVRTLEAMGQFLTDDGKCDEAIRYINKAINADTFNPRLWTLLSEAQYTAGDFTGGVESASSAIDIDEKYTQAYLLRGENRVWLHQFREAHADIDYYLRHGGEPFDSVLYYDGISLIALRRYQEAYMQLKKAIDLCGNTPDIGTHIKFQTAYVAARLGRLDEALDELDESYTSSFHIAKPILKGKFYCLTGHWEEGLRLFNETIAATQRPNDAVFEAANQLYNMEAWEQALPYFLKLYEWEGDVECPTSSYIALCYQHLGDEANYEKYRREAQTDPNNILDQTAPRVYDDTMLGYISNEL